MPRQIKIEDAMGDRAHAYRAFIQGWQDHDLKARLYFGKVVKQISAYAHPIYQDAVAIAPVLDDLAIAKDLQIEVTSGNHPSSVCAVQDLLFSFIHRIPEDHSLRSLKVNIAIKMPNDATSRNFLTADVWPYNEDGRDFIHECRLIQPGHLSRAHMTAFLADPLRMIRNLNQGKREKDMFKLTFDGNKGTILGDIPWKVGNLVRGDAEVKDYEVFRDQYAAVCDFIESMRAAISHTDSPQDPIDLTADVEQLPTPVTPVRHAIIDLTADNNKEEIRREKMATDSTPILADLNGMKQTLAEARIRGSFQDLKQALKNLVTLSDRVVNMLEKTDGLELENDARARLDLIASTRVRATSLPPDESDVSLYGYAETDACLSLPAEARKREKQKKREAKATSKRKGTCEERDEDGEDDSDDSSRPRQKIARGWHGSI